MQRKLMVLLALALTTGFVCAPVSAATMYKWVDEQGTVHYGYNPPPGVEAEPFTGNRLTTVPVPEQPEPETDTDAGGGAAENAADGEEPQKSIAQQRREERAAARAEAQERQAQLQAQCQAMRQQLAWVEPNPRVIVQDADGTTRRMDDEERVRMVNEAKEFLANNDCD